MERDYVVPEEQGIQDVWVERAGGRIVDVGIKFVDYDGVEYTVHVIEEQDGDEAILHVRADNGYDWESYCIAEL